MTSEIEAHTVTERAVREIRAAWALLEERRGPLEDRLDKIQVTPGVRRIMDMAESARGELVEALAEQVTGEPETDDGWFRASTLSAWGLAASTYADTLRDLDEVIADSVAHELPDGILANLRGQRRTFDNAFLEVERFMAASTDDIANFAGWAQVLMGAELAKIGASWQNYERAELAVTDWLEMAADLRQARMRLVETVHAALGLECALFGARQLVE